MIVLKRLFVSLFFVIISISASYAEECILSDDMGTGVRVIVPANPSLLTNSGYSEDVTTQRALWTDSGLFTNGDSFYFEIEGSWTPWFGNIADMTTVDGRSVSIVPDKNKFCILGTRNKDAELMTKKGEFDHITSSYRVEDNGGAYSKVPLSSEIQASCWLTAGEGLYIGFFGKNGDQSPQLATHLKSAEVVCDAQYATDKNGDGIITLDECYDFETKDGKKVPTENKAYYKPYLSHVLVSGVKCDKDYLHSRNKDGFIGINDCYEDIETDTGKIVRVDKTIFTYRIPYFYKTTTKQKVGKNDRIKFIIYDKYYKDNIGEYVLSLYSGFSDMKDPGLIERILNDLENVFIGSRNDSGELVGGILKQFYTYIISDTVFGLMVRTFIIIYMAFIGLSFAMGSLEYKTKEMMFILLKLTFILSFTTVTSWNVYDYFVVRFFYDGFSSIITMTANIVSRLYESSGVQGVSTSSKFAFIDTLILFLFSESVTRKIQGLFFGVWFGFIVIPIIYGLIVYYIIQLVNAIFPYIIMFIQAVIALALGPIFISLYLFKTTEFMFKNWLAFVGGRFINMAFLFLFLYSFASIIRAKFMELLYFEVCKIPFWQAIASEPDGNINVAMKFFSFGLKVWDAKWTESSPEPSFFGFCINLLFIFLLIYLFGIIMKKVPTVVDSMIDIGGESGGGLDKSGGSKLGAKISSTFEGALNSSIKVTGDRGKDVGIVKRIGQLNREYITKPLGKGLWNITGGGLTNVATRNAKGNSISNDVMKKSNMKGFDAVNLATNNYANYLKSTKKYDPEKMEKEVGKYREKMEKDFIEKPIEKQLGSVIDDMKNEIRNNPSKNFTKDYINGKIKGQMDDFVNKNIIDSNKTSSTSDFEKYYGENSKLLSSFTKSLIGTSNYSGNRGFAGNQLGLSQPLTGEGTHIPKERSEMNVNKKGQIPSNTSSVARDTSYDKSKNIEKQMPENNKNITSEKAGISDNTSKQKDIGLSDASKNNTEQRALYDEIGLKENNIPYKSIEGTPLSKTDLDNEMIRGELQSSKDNLNDYADRKAQEANRMSVYASTLLSADIEGGSYLKLLAYQEQVLDLKYQAQGFNTLSDIEKSGAISEIKENSIEKYKEESELVIKNVANLNEKHEEFTKEIGKVFDESLKSKINKDDELTRETLEKEKTRAKKISIIAETAVGEGTLGGKVAMGDNFDLNSAKQTHDRSKALKEKMSSLEKVFAEKERLTKIKTFTDDIDKKTKTLKELKDSKAKSGSNDSKKSNIKALEDSIKETEKILKDNFDCDTKDRGKLNNELNSKTDELNGLRKDIDKEFTEIAKDLKNSLNLEVKPEKSSDVKPENNQVVGQQIEEQVLQRKQDKKGEEQPTILTVEGINPNLGIEGIKQDLGIGVENLADLIGLSGASSLIMGNESEQNSVKPKKPETMINENRLKVAESMGKVLQFQLEKAKNSGNQREIEELEQKIKDNKQKIEIFKDDVDED